LIETVSYFKWITKQFLIIYLYLKNSSQSNWSNPNVVGVNGFPGMIDPILVRTQLKSYINSDNIKFPYDHMVTMTGSVE
jgi:hypothetical protein